MTQPNKKLSIIVPVYNEAQTLRPALERLFSVELPLSLDVVVVDDGSTDDGLASIQDLVDSGSVRVLEHRTNKGKGAAIRTGIAAAKGDLLTILDADLEYDPRNLGELVIPLLESRAEVVYGTRSFGSHTAYSFWYVVGNRVLSFWASFLFNAWLSDIETCFKVAPLRVWKGLRLKRDGFGIEAEVTAKILRSDRRIYEIPIRYTARTREEGKKLNSWDGIEALWILFVERFKARRRIPDG